MPQFNEITRVQIPALVHLVRLGYTYVGKIAETSAGTGYDPATNILIPVFKKQFVKLNPSCKQDAMQILQTIRQELDNDDLGRSFYKRLVSISPVRLIDFENPENNVFHCTAEFIYRGDQESFFVPDITLFVNGLPLVFLEVKKPNNQGGMLVECERMNKQRFPNKKFRRFINITQLMLFSNNMEYDTLGGRVLIQGAFYCTASRDSAKFNCFREENPANADIAPFIQNYPYKDIDQKVEKRILTDFNCQIIHNTPEYETNCKIDTPTNRILTSMCSPERLLFLLKYGIAYVKDEREVEGKLVSLDQKHIMRYQQMFAALAVREKLRQGKKSGVIWHTQGSGKTALAYHLTFVLSDFFAQQQKVAKFYFIVDRLDLLEQASQEFAARGLEVKTAVSREKLMKQFRVTQAQQGSSGRPEITVVNIQLFEEDDQKISLDYAVNLQRVFIIDEAHRGYNPKGTFLANLFDADRDSVKIALTGTPLLKEERESWRVFGDYFHTYYYDKSIQDGYTLKIIREDIETSYRENLAQIQEKLEMLVQKKNVDKSQIVEHESYVKALLRYIIQDLQDFRTIHGDKTLGGMIVCETSGQARNLYKFFDSVQKELDISLNAELVLHNIADKETLKSIVKDFKKNMTVDILIVFNMLLTGFDAPRLKKLYLGRTLHDHTLLQALTRVNRPYKNNRYGYVVDFANIKANFEATNAAYMRELSRFNDIAQTGEGTNTFTQILEDKDSLVKQMQEVRETLFDYSTDNAEKFSAEISLIKEKPVLQKLQKALLSAQDCANLVRTFGNDDLKQSFAKIALPKLSEMLSEVQHVIENINQKESFAEKDSTKQIISEAMADITFTFKKVGEEELTISAESIALEEKWQKIIHTFTENTDQDDPEYIYLKEAFMQRFREHGFIIDSIEKYQEHVKFLDDLVQKLQILQQKNAALAEKYGGDLKFLRLHKRIREENSLRAQQGQKPILSNSNEELVRHLCAIKTGIDQKIYDKSDIVNNDALFGRIVLQQIAQQFREADMKPVLNDLDFMQKHLSKQYLEQLAS